VITVRSACRSRSSWPAGSSAARVPLVVHGEFLGGNLDASIAAAAILALAAFGVLDAVRAFRWGRVLDARTVG
jgi:hypothetical protein